MNDVVLTDKQARAVSKIKRWFQSARDGSGPQIFRLFGYAGTGKTTILKYVIGELGLEASKVAYGAFTGKAALVMRRNGLEGATTCHRMIYLPSLPSEDAVERERDILKQMIEDKNPKKDIREQKKKIDNMLSPHFYLNEDSIANQVSLIVLDEVSMVDNKLALDIMSFGTPVLVVGDPGQLPPIEGEGYFTKEKPDVMLTEIHRQALDSPIIRLATMAREGQAIPYGKYGRGIRKVPVINKTATYLKYDQVIVGLNATRYKLNREIRNHLGFKDKFPTGELEKIICLKNNYDIGLINGMFVVLKDIQSIGPDHISANIYDEEGNLLVASAATYNGEFLQHIKFRKDRMKNDTFKRRGYVEATFGWAITCHKAQGSQWNKIMVYDESRMFRKERRRWLYTAITRAEERLTIVG